MTKEIANENDFFDVGTVDNEKVCRARGFAYFCGKNLVKSLVSITFEQKTE